MIVGSTLDVLRIANRPLIERLINGIGNSGVNIIIESVLGKLRNGSEWRRIKIEKIKINNITIYSYIIY